MVYFYLFVIPLTFGLRKTKLIFKNSVCTQVILKVFKILIKGKKSWKAFNIFYYKQLVKLSFELGFIPSIIQTLPTA